jgi:hypothetical protein
MWKGPSEGLSQSLISKFLECPFRFYIYAILGLEEDRPPNINLVWGNGFHKGLEKLFDFYQTNPEGEFNEALNYVWPFILEEVNKYSKETQLPTTVPHSIKEMIKIYPLPQEIGQIESEVTFTYPFTLPSGREVSFRGKVDGLGPTTLIEHKCKGKFDSLQTFKETAYDLQTNLYCWIQEREKIVYDLIRIPEAQYFSPKPSQHELPENFTYRLFHNYNGKNYPVKRFRKYWIDQLTIHLPRFQQLSVVNHTIVPLAERIYDWYEYVTQPGFDIENPKWYNGTFYKTPIRHFDPGKTEFYKCNYWDFLVGDQEMECLKPVKSIFTELEEQDQ